MLENKEMEDRHLKELIEFHREKDKALENFHRLYHQYYHSGQQITTDQRAEVRKAFTAHDKDFSPEKVKEFEAKQRREREEYNAEAYQKWTKLELKRDDLINQYGNIDKVPKEVMDKYKEEKRAYDFEWGENGNQLKSLLKEQQQEISERERLRDEMWNEQNLSPYQKTIRKHMQERIDFNGKVADNWQQHEKYRDDLVKEYNGWNNVPAYQKELFKQRKEGFEKEWGDEGTQKQAMRKRHHEEIATQMRIETEKHRSPEKDKDRQREKE